MTIEIYTICDFAQPFGSSMNILNPFDTIIAKGLPSLKSFHVAIRIRYEHDIQNDKTVSIKIIDPQNNDLTPLIKNNNTIATYPGRTFCINHIISFENFVFNNWGKYSIIFETEGQIYEMPFYLEEEKKQ